MAAYAEEVAAQIMDWAMTDGCGEMMMEMEMEMGGRRRSTEEEEKEEEGDGGDDDDDDDGEEGLHGMADRLAHSVVISSLRQVMMEGS